VQIGYATALAKKRGGEKRKTDVAAGREGLRLS